MYFTAFTYYFAPPPFSNEVNDRFSLYTEHSFFSKTSNVAKQIYVLKK